MTYLNIAAYKFIKLDELSTLRTVIKARAAENDLFGTVLLSPEGINIMLAGLSEKINHFKHFLSLDKKFSDLQYKESYSNDMTYNKLLVKIKKEIISFSIEGIQPEVEKAPYIQPAELKKLLDQLKNSTENSTVADIILLDTRNHYEINLGTFENAINLNLKHFRDFPNAAKKLPSEYKEKMIVTFCTGGIRCEKAAPYLLQQGFKNVFQLEGGILKYFLECGSSHYSGDCFLFDKRISVNSDFKASSDIS